MYWHASLEMQAVTVKEKTVDTGSSSDTTWQHMAHENVHKFIAEPSGWSCVMGQSMRLLAFEACEDSLGAYLSRRSAEGGASTLSTATATNWACQVASGLKYLHASKELVHRRLCSGSVVMRYDHYGSSDQDSSFDNGSNANDDESESTSLKTSLLEHAVSIDSVASRPPASMWMAPEALTGAAAKYSEDM